MSMEKPDNTPREGQGAPDGVAQSARACLGQDGLLSIIMPAFNLGKSIFENLSEVHHLFADVIPFEIVPVDDGSADETRAEIERAATAFPQTVRPVFCATNTGKGAALFSGFAKSRGSYVLLLDGDLDLNPAFVWRFFDIMREEQADIVIGSKMHPESKIDYPWQRRLASLVYYGIVKILVGLPVHDTQTGMKLFRREALDYSLSRMLAKRFAFDLEVLSIAKEHGFKTAEAPVELDFGNKCGSLTYENIRQVMTDTLAIFYRLRILRYYETLEPHPLPEIRPRVSAVIACPGASACLDECLRGLERQAWPSLEAIVLPDAPTGRQWPDFVREIPTGKVRPAEKRNIGIQQATGEVVAFIDDDAAPLAGWLEHAIPYFSDPEVAAVGGPAVTPPDDSPMAKLGGAVYANLFVSGAYRRRYKPTRVCHEDDLPSCNLLVRTATLRESGGFDTTHWPGEDTILCLEIVHRLKKRMIYDPRVQVTHHRRPLFAPHLRQIARYAAHRGFFARKFPETSLRLSYMIPSLFVLGVVVGLPLTLVHPVLKGVYLAVLAIYLALTFLSTASLRRPLDGAITWAGVVATHLTYGVCFLWGLLSRDLVKEVRPFDHHSEKVQKK